MVLKDPLHRIWNLGKLKTGDQSSSLAPSFPFTPPPPASEPPSVPPSCFSFSGPLLGSGFIHSCLDYHSSLLPNLAASPHSPRGSFYTQSGLWRPLLLGLPWRPSASWTVSTSQPGVQCPIGPELLQVSTSSPPPTAQWFSTWSYSIPHEHLALSGGIFDCHNVEQVGEMQRMLLACSG